MLSRWPNDAKGKTQNARGFMTKVAIPGCSLVPAAQAQPGAASTQLGAVSARSKEQASFSDQTDPAASRLLGGMMIVRSGFCRCGSRPFT